MVAYRRAIMVVVIHMTVKFIRAASQVNLQQA